VFFRIGDVIRHPIEALEGIHGFEIAAQAGIHPRPVQHRLLAIEIDELLGRERRRDEIGQLRLS
jgi:hypothetical protein